MANFITKIPVFVREVKVELTKVSWPTRKELKGATMLVIVVTGILAIFIYVVDAILTKIVDKVF